MQEGEHPKGGGAPRRRGSTLKEGEHSEGGGAP